MTRPSEPNAQDSCPPFLPTSGIAAEPREFVVVVHGIMSHPWWMALLCKRIRKAGFATLNWSYRSYLGSLQYHAQCLRKLLHEHSAKYEKIHVVAHSMGCIVTRTALNQFDLPNLGRVVFLTPPHQGTAIATRIAPWVRSFLPIVSQLTDKPDSFVRSLPLPHYPFAIVSAEYDMLVPRNSTQLEGCMDYLHVCTMHNGVLFHRDVAENTIRFLKTGSMQTS